jgi:hypothetical protein
VNGVKSDIERDMAIEEYRQLQQKVQAEAGALEQSVKQVTLTADQQVQRINEAVAKLSSQGESPPGQANQTAQVPQPPLQSSLQPAVEPSAILPVNKPANQSE